jgi:hypothetical protein
MSSMLPSCRSALGRRQSLPRSAAYNSSLIWLGRTGRDRVHQDRRVKRASENAWRLLPPPANVAPRWVQIVGFRNVIGRVRGAVAQWSNRRPYEAAL